MRSKIKGIGTTVIILMLANLGVKIFGLWREILFAEYYGTTIITDAYIIANNIPTVIFSAIGSALATTYIPMYSRANAEEGQKSANSFSIHLVEIVIAICMILIVVGELFTRQVVLLFASGYTGETLTLTIEYAKILIPSILSMALMNIFGCYLQIRNRFLPISIVPIVGNIIIIIGLFISNCYRSPIIAVWGTLGGITAQVLYYLPIIKKEGFFKGDFRECIRDKYVWALIPLVIPVLLGEGVNEINSVIDRSLVSGLGTGSVSSLNYSYKIINLLMGVMVVSLITIVYPKLSKIAAKKDIRYLKEYGTLSVNLIITFVLPLTVIILFFSKDIVSILFGRGKFDSSSIFATSLALKCYVIGLPAMGVREIITKILFSIQDTKTPMRNGIICALFNILLDIVLIRFLGCKGAALATSFAAIISSMYLLFFVIKHDLLQLKSLLVGLGKSFIGCALISILLYILKNLVIDRYSIGTSYSLLVFCVCFVSITLYIIIQIMLGNNPFVLLRRLNEK